MWGLYCLLAIAMAILAVITAPRDKRHASAVLLPVLFFLLHVSYGLGTLRSFFMKK
jgi:lipopolysaccharide export LptBFGC system permease protein LptF